jgi:hypothetical protein
MTRGRAGWRRGNALHLHSADAWFELWLDSDYRSVPQSLQANDETISPLFTDSCSIKSFNNAGAGGSVVVEILCYKPEDRGFETR